MAAYNDRFKPSERNDLQTIGDAAPKAKQDVEKTNLSIVTGKNVWFVAKAALTVTTLCL